MTGTWLAVLVTAAGCYALKVAGLTLPERLLAQPPVRRSAELMPIALLTALAVVQVAVSGHSLTVDPARLAGFGAAAVTLLAGDFKFRARPREAQPREAQPREAQPPEAQPPEAQPPEAQPPEAQQRGADRRGALFLVVIVVAAATTALLRAAGVS